MSFSVDQCKFYCQESLSATVVHNDYADASTMSFDHLLIYGVMSDDVNTVLLNGVEHSFFIFDAANKVQM